MPHASFGGNPQGINWSIERGLVTPSTAETAGLEILGAIATGHPMVTYDHTQPKNGFTGYVIDGLDGLTSNDISAPDFRFGSLMMVREALTPFKDPDLLADEETAQYDRGMVNILEPGGKVPGHRDNKAWSLVFVSLTAEARAKIKSPGESAYAEETLRPGDALVMTNPASKSLRPKHKIINLSGLPRVSYGEYTTQRRV